MEKKSAKKAEKNVQSTGADSGASNDEIPGDNASTSTHTDRQPSDARLLAQIHDDEMAADVEPDEDDDDNDDENSSCSEWALSVLSECGPDIASDDTVPDDIPDVSVSATTGVVTVKVGKYLVVKYDGNFYPGVVT